LQVKRLGDTYLLRLELGEELVARLNQFADTYRVGFGTVEGSGALERVTLGTYDGEARRYREERLEGPVELLTMTGSIAQGEDGRRAVQAHVTVARADGGAVGGRLLRAVVGPAVEVVVETTAAIVRRCHDPESGLELWDLDAMETLAA
jgi:hypothetical protein